MPAPLNFSFTHYEALAAWGRVTYDCRVEGPGHPVRMLVAGALWGAEAAKVPGLWSPSRFLSDVSMAVPPVPGLWEKPLVLMAPSALETPKGAARILVHELCHVWEMARRFSRAASPTVLYCWLYGTDVEVRATCEANAYLCEESFGRSLGDAPRDADHYLARMRGGYLIDAPLMHSVEAHLRVGLASIDHMGVFNHPVALGADEWLQGLP